MLSRLFICFIWFITIFSGFAQELPNSYSLNGIWKFNTILGEGSNYLNIEPEEGDIIIDNSRTELLELKGNWQTKTDAERASECWKDDYLAHYFGWQDTSMYVRFKPEIPKAGYYEAFIFYPFGHHLTAQIQLKHANGISEKHNSFRNRCNKWISLGIYQYEEGKGAYIEISAQSPGGVVADAIMLRPVEEDKYMAAQKEKERVMQSEFDASAWHDLTVPGHWGMLNAYSNYTGRGWYRKEINIPSSWKKNSDERIRLKFDGVYHKARVFLNGEFVGSHQGGFTPFEFDVTSIIDFEGENILALEADNSQIVGATWNWGGIIRDVYLVKNKDVRMSYQYIHAEPDLEEGTARIKLKVRVENNSSIEKDVQVEAQLINKEVIKSLGGKLRVAANSVKEIELETTLAAKDVLLWHFDFPNLYKVKTSISIAGEVLDTRTDNFGIRKFEVTEKQMILNGEPVRLAGFNRVSDHRYWGSSEPQEIIDLDVRLMKNAGANFMRIMHGTQNKKLIEACDREGILLFEEVNVREIQNAEFTAPDYPLIKQWLTEMVERDVNHPSIVGWSVGNELSYHNDYVKMIIPFVKEELDPYRLVTCVSNTGYHKNDNPENDPLQYSDIIMQNIYQENHGERVLDVIHERWPNKTIFVSEFGVGRFSTPSLDNDLPLLNPWNNEIRDKRTYVSGAASWTFNDYRSGYSQSLESENRAWGLVNVWRQKRRLYATAQKENSPVKDIEVKNIDLKKCAADVLIPIRGYNDYPSYIMKEYQLKFSFYNQKGELLREKTKALPVLSPANIAWNGTVEWDKFKEDAAFLNVTLLSPNGYTRYEKDIYFTVPDKPEIKNVIIAKGQVRVLFDKKAGAFEHYVKYTLGAKEFLSKKTIANYIDIDRLSTETALTLQLIACNNKGESEPFFEEIPTSSENELPPVIWDSFIRNNKLVVGYSGEIHDQSYTIQYGYSIGNLNKSFTTKARGMLTVDLGKETVNFFRLKRTTSKGSSEWSQIIKVKE